MKLFARIENEILKPVHAALAELVREAQAARYYRRKLAELADEVGAEPDDLDAIIAAVRRRGVAINGAFELRQELLAVLGWRIGSNAQIVSTVKEMAIRLDPRERAPAWAKPGAKVQIVKPGLPDDGQTGTINAPVPGAEGTWVRGVYTSPTWYSWEQLRPLEASAVGDASA